VDPPTPTAVPSGLTIREIHEFYTEIGLGREQDRLYMAGLGHVPESTPDPLKVTFIEAGTTSFGSAGEANARLERYSQ
jgi:hypothetical protein